MFLEMTANMLNQNNTIELTDKLRGYANKVMKETGRKILIHNTSDMGMSGMLAYFLEHPTHILVCISADIPMNLLEFALAHEFTHGLLAYGRGYCRLHSRGEPDEREKHGLWLLASMIEDIVVNRMTQAEGFEPLASDYVEELGRETAAAAQGLNYYGGLGDPILKEHFMVYRYIQAWGFLHTLRLGNLERIPLLRFEKAFREAHPRQTRLADKIIKIILENDIFSAEGYSLVLRMLAYNLFLLFKMDFAKETEYRQQIKTFRLKYMFLAGKIIRTARSVVMKLSEKYPYHEVYEKSIS
jgi:hypothetical protein